MNQNQVNPSDALRLISLASELREEGEIQKSTEALYKVLEMVPGHPETLFWLAHQTELKEGSEVVIQLQNWESQIAIATTENQSYILFALARLREKQGLYKEAFKLYEKANQEQKKSLRLLNTDAGIYISQAKIFRDLYQKLGNVKSLVLDENKGQGIVFIVGLPRCGSTLVETVLSMDQESIALGELTAMKEAIVGSDISAILQTQIHDFDKLSISIRKLGELYLSNLSGRARVKFDKTLINFFFLGLISKALPMARIVHVQRSPMDQILSAWKTRFVKGHTYSLELNDLVRVYLSYSKLMAFWSKEPGINIYHCKYERLISDPVQETKLLAKYCGLNWNKSMLYPEHSMRKISTASFNQARKPINNNSIGNWKKYSEELKLYSKQLLCEGITIT